MPLILRKCNYNGYSSRNFYYGNAGDIATCPDWNPKPECGNGLHGLKEGNGNWALLEGDDWLIIEANDEDVVNIDKDKCKFRTGKILFRGTAEDLSKSEFPAKLNLNSKCAYNWAFYIGNEDVMMHKITDSEWAYHWALNIGNHDIMMHKITESEFAYYWASNIGNKDIMMHKINHSQHAYYWAVNIGNHDVMINKITDPGWAFYWAKCIGNADIMKPKVIDPEYINRWNVIFPENPIIT